MPDRVPTPAPTSTSVDPQPAVSALWWLVSLKNRIFSVDRDLAERWAVAGVLLVYSIFQINAALHHGSWGQDFNQHVQWIQAAHAHPWHFATHFEANRPEPPLFHLLGAAVVQLTQGRMSLEVFALLSAGLNLLALFMAYRLIRSLIENRILRLACLTFFTFLPCVMISTVVLASDAFTLPIFVGMLTLLIGLLRWRFTRGFWSRTAGTAVLLALGIGTKFTFESQAIGLLASLCVFPFDKLLEKYRALQASILIGAVGAAGFILILLNLTSIRAPGIAGFAMTPRDVLLPHSRDVHIFRAPEYDERRRGAGPTDPLTPHGPYELLVVHKYSYPALLHLGIFTDILNIYQDDPSDGYFGIRTKINASRMRTAVKSGLIFSISCFFLTILALGRTFYLTLIKRKQQELPRFALGLCGLGWFLNIVVFLPLIPTYWGGFWLPRLIVPALLAFTILSATELDRLLRGRASRWSWTILTMVVVQSAIHLSFLWLHGPIRLSLV